jgi:hypothetical protein
MSDHLQKSKTSTLTLATGLVLVLLFCGLAWFVIQERDAIPTPDDVQKEKRVKNLADLNTANEKVLTEYRWVDKPKGIIGIPIERAMGLILADLQTNKPHPAGPLTTPATAGQAPSPTPAPAQPASVQPAAPQPAATKPPAPAQPAPSATN